MASASLEGGQGGDQGSEPQREPDGNTIEGCGCLAVLSVAGVIAAGLLAGSTAESVPDDVFAQRAKAHAAALLGAPANPDQRFSLQYLDVASFRQHSTEGGSGVRGFFPDVSDDVIVGQDCLAGSPYDTRSITRTVENYPYQPKYGWHLETEDPHATVRATPGGFEVDSLKDVPRAVKSLRFSVAASGVVHPADAATVAILRGQQYGCETSGAPVARVVHGASGLEESRIGLIQ
jgi:hypothetical protein